jgi:hypothetical protein
MFLSTDGQTWPPVQFIHWVQRLHEHENQNITIRWFAFNTRVCCSDGVSDVRPCWVDVWERSQTGFVSRPALARVAQHGPCRGQRKCTTRRSTDAIWSSHTHRVPCRLLVSFRTAVRLLSPASVSHRQLDRVTPTVAVSVLYRFLRGGTSWQLS